MHSTSTNTHFTDTYPQDHSCLPTSNPLLPDLRATIIHTPSVAHLLNLGATHPSLSTPGAHFTFPPHITHPSARTRFYIHPHEPHHCYSYSWRNHTYNLKHTLSPSHPLEHTLSPSHPLTGGRVIFFFMGIIFSASRRCLFSFG